MGSFKEITIPVTTAGSNGSATGTAKSETVVNGAIYGYHIDYHASAPSSTVVTITEDGGAGRTLFAAPAGNTDIPYQPRVPEHGATGSALGTAAPAIIAGRKLTATVTLSNALTNAVVVTAYVLE